MNTPIPANVAANQALYEQTYPLPCSACRRTEEEHRPHQLSDGRTMVVGCYCRCGAYKGPAIASPLESWRAQREIVRARPKPPAKSPAPRGPEPVAELLRDESVIPRRQATQTHVDASAIERERPSPPLSPERRFAFLKSCATLGADEHRIRCDLAARGEELEDCSEEASKAVYRSLKAESTPGAGAGPAGTTTPAANSLCGASPADVCSDERPASPQPAPAPTPGTGVADVDCHATREDTNA